LSFSPHYTLTTTTFFAVHSELQQNIYTIQVSFLTKLREQNDRSQMQRKLRNFCADFAVVMPTES